MVKPYKTAALLTKPEVPAATPEELSTDLADPNTSMNAGYMHTGPVRRAIDAMYTLELTPSRAIRAMRVARDLSDVPFFTNCAMEALRQDPNLQAVLQTRVLAVSAMALAAEPAGKKLQDRKAAEAIQELLLSEPVESIIPHLLMTGTYLGFGLAQNIWNTASSPWTIDAIQDVPSHFVVIDRNDAKTPMLLSKELGDPFQQLPYGKFIYHRPGLIAGNPATSGIAYTALFYYTIKASVLKDWVGFVGLYGQPIRVGKYPQGMGNTPAGKKDLDVLKRALRDLGGDAWAMLPDSMQVEIVEAASRNASAEVFERLCRFLDEQLAKLVLGGSLTSGTGNTGSGGSKALGQVHNEVREDIIRSDAKQLANTLRRCLVKPFVEWNFGTGVAVPAVYFLIEEQQDVAAWVTATTAAMAVGLKVPAVEFYKRLEIREPEAGEEVLSMAQAQAQAAPVSNAQPADAATPAADTQTQTATLAAASDDELDALIAELQAEDGYAAAVAEVDDAILSAIESATDLESLRAALVAAVKTGKVEGMQAVLTAGMTAARVAGDVGAQLGGK